VSQRVVIGIDLGSARCGWGVLTPAGARLDSGVWVHKRSRWEGGGVVFVLFERFFSALVLGHRAAGREVVVVFEEVRRHLGTDAAHMYGGLLATATAWCNASKDEMIAAAETRWGVRCESDDEADALWTAMTWVRGEA
jgi:Holliday junction resolvasome RuvABC endonuclease subunit